MTAPAHPAPDTPISASWPAVIYGRPHSPEHASIWPNGTSPLLDPSAHCTHSNCQRADTVTVDGVRGRRCPEHPAVFEPAYAVHLAVTGWPAAALAYCRWGGAA